MWICDMWLHMLLLSLPGMLGIFACSTCFAVAQAEANDRKGFSKWKFQLFQYFCVVVRHKLYFRVFQFRENNALLWTGVGNSVLPPKQFYFKSKMKFESYSISVLFNVLYSWHKLIRLWSRHLSNTLCKQGPQHHKSLHPPLPQSLCSAFNIRPSAKMKWY